MKKLVSKDHSKKYSFGFTAASLRLNETVKIERVFREGGYADYSEIGNREEIIGKGNKRTSIREFRELINRLQKLTQEQKNVLLNGNLTTQKQIAFLGVCKHYRFIREFAVEVLREKMLVYDFQLTDADYFSFERRKGELEGLADSTKRKVKQVLLKILEQAGLIDNVKSQRIQIQILGQSVTDAIMNENPQWLKIFLYNDGDILKLKQTYGKH